MPPVPSFPESQIDSLARFLGECGTGQDITRVLADQQFVDKSEESTKWRRLYWVFQEMQRTDRSANRILVFMQSYLAPAGSSTARTTSRSAGQGSTSGSHSPVWNSVRTGSSVGVKRRGR